MAKRSKKPQLFKEEVTRKMLCQKCGKEHQEEEAFLTCDYCGKPLCVDCRVIVDIGMSADKTEFLTNINVCDEHVQAMLAKMKDRIDRDALLGLLRDRKPRKTKTTDTATPPKRRSRKKATDETQP